MDHRIARARPLGRALTAAMAAAGLLTAAALFVAPAALAQTPPKQPAKPAAPKQAPAAQPAPQQPPQQGAANHPQFIYSGWVKICQKGPETGDKMVCVVHNDARLENGMPVANAEILQVEGAKEKLRGTVSIYIPVHLPEGARVLLDQEVLGTAPYQVCTQVGCMAEYETKTDTIAKLKKGRILTIQAINMQNTPISLPLPLAGFAKAYDGPATDPKVVEEQQRKLQEGLLKQAEDARKKLEAHQPTAQAPAAAPAQKE